MNSSSSDSHTLSGDTSDSDENNSTESDTPSHDIQSESKTETSEMEEETIFPIIDEKIGAFLSSTPPVIENILINFNAHHLNQCAQVCKMWSDIARIIKKKRHTPFMLFQVSIGEASNVDNQFDPYVLNDFVYDNLKNLKLGFLKTLNNLYIEPNLVIMFKCSFFRVNGIVSNVTGKLITKNLPKHSTIICLETTGVVGTPIDMPYEIENCSAVSGIFFPKNVPGLEFYHFEIPSVFSRKRKVQDNNLHEKYKNITKNNIQEITNIPPDKKIKCLLLMISEFPQGYTRRSITNSIVEYYLKENENKIAFGGGVANSVNYKNSDKLTAKLCSIGTALVITGDSVTAASLVITPNIKTRAKVLDKLEEFKKGFTMQKKSLAFLFACCARGEVIFKETNVESSCFKKVFPNTKLVGMFGNGEFGINYTPNTPYAEVKKVNYMHSYSSVFVIISWNEN